jgi:hypothetical protein
MRGLMVFTAVVALGLGLARVSPWLGVGYVVAAAAYPVFVAVDQSTQTRRLRSDFRRAVLCYIAGVLVPSIFLMVGPIVLPHSFYDFAGRVLESVTYWYTFAVLETAVLMAFLSVGPSWRPQLCGLISGALWLGAVCYAVLGVFLLPFSIIFLAAGIGIVGFIPFLSAWAFRVQAGLAASRAEGPRSSGWLLALQLAGAALAAGLPLLFALLIEPPGR